MTLERFDTLYVNCAMNGPISEFSMVEDNAIPVPSHQKCLAMGNNRELSLGPAETADVHLVFSDSLVGLN